MVSSTSGASNATPNAEPGNNNALPMQPHITPALSVAGVILILTGTLYTLIGIKNRWIQIFLSAAYLVSICVLVLIDYVMHPPVRDAIQGAYFVAVFMTGCVFAGGALIFKEVTEGLGCLLGGFCLGMWFLTLKSGGIVSGSISVGILLAIFCVMGWGLSFSKYTRDYAIIGSTSFAGATALTLGIDCFSRAGYKEFWLYIWDLNDNLFPLNTNNYPITRGIRVEIAIIVLGTLVGIISQLKLWKVIRERRKEKEAIQIEEESRRGAVEETLGRHLQRQNEMARQQWETIYGDGAKRPMSMVESVMEPGDRSKRASRVSVMTTRMHSGLGAHSQVVELRPVNPRQISANMKRQSTMSVNAIPEETEEHEQPPYNVASGAISATSLSSYPEAEAEGHNKAEDSTAGSEPSLTEGLTHSYITGDASSVGTAEQEPTKRAKQRSFQGLLKRISGHQSSPGSILPSPAVPTMSQEALVGPQIHHSRASSVAATLDEDYDRPDASRLSVFYNEATKPPAIVLSPALHTKNSERKGPYLDVPPSPPALSVEFDPEELARPVAHGASLAVKKSESSLRSVSQAPLCTSKRSETTDEHIPMGSPQANLTTDALQAVPSQLSNVVLSYRTNEWAKHITTAEAPVFEDPQSIEADGKDELPTQVLNTVTGAKVELQSPIEKSPSPESMAVIDRSLSAAAKPPTPHILLQREDTVKSDKSGGSAESGSLQKADLKQNQSAGDLPKATSQSRPTLSIGHGLRSSSTPILGQSQVTSPIEEYIESSFSLPSRTSTTPSPAGAAVLSAQRQNLLRNQSIQRSQSQQDLLLRQSMIQSPSRTSLATSNTAILNSPPIALPTRLSTYDSRQPIRSSAAPTPRQRESTLADWRTSIRQDVGLAEHPDQTMAQRRAEMLAQKAMLKRSESHQSYVQASREGAMDQLMRRGDMQEAHRTALRRMQEVANRHV